MINITSNLDTTLFYFINHGLSNPLFDTVMPFITKRPPLFFLPILLLIFIKNRRLALYTLATSLFALAITDAVTNLLKHTIERPRPFMELKDVITLVGRGRSFSMPSAHASNVTGVATVFMYFILQLKDRFTRISSAAYLVLLVLSIAFSRVYVGVHYPSDVLAGSILGLFLALSVLALCNYSRSMIDQRRYERLGMVLLILLSLFRLYYIQMGIIDLSPDEAHYWEWSRRLDLSYYSKGPAIAYIIRAGTLLFGNTEMGIRFPAVVLLFFSSLFLYSLARELSRDFFHPDSRNPIVAGIVSAMFLQIIPLFSAYGVVLTIDSPFIFFWTVSLYLFYRAQKDWPARKGGIKLWLLLGLTTGLGVLTKYTMAFFYLSALLYLLTEREKRTLLFRPLPWIALVLSIIIASPIIIWNYKHNWVTFLHTAGQAHLYDGFTLKPLRLLEFVGSQLGVITPILFIMMLVATLRLKSRASSFRLLFWFSIPTLVFFLLKSLQGKVQANWALPAYISMLVALGFYITYKWKGFSKYLKATFLTGVIMALVVTAVAHYPRAFHIPPRYDPTARLRGWKPLGKEVSRLVKKMKKPLFIFSDRYQISSELAFYVEGKPTTYCVNTGRRMNQYDLWPGFYDLAGYDAIFVTWGNKGLAPILRDRFESYEKRLLVVKEKGNILREYSIFLCYGFKGMEKSTPREF